MTPTPLEEVLRGLAARFPGELGLVVRGYRRPVATGDSPEVDIRIAPELVMPACSIIKLPILWTLLEEVEAGRVDLDHETVLRTEDKAESRGILKEMHEGLSPTIRDLATLMIVLSDNTATNMLLDRLDFGRVNDTCYRLGLRNTVVSRKMMDGDARTAGRENLTTPLDCARLLELMVYRHHLSPAGHDLLLDIMSKQQLNDLLPFLMPEGTRFAHKTGELPGFRHDVGLLLLDEWVVSISALSHWHERMLDSVQLLNNIGKEVYESFSTV